MGGISRGELELVARVQQTGALEMTTVTFKGRVAIGCDEAGYRLKELLSDFMLSLNWGVDDFGCHSEESVDYPDVAYSVASAVARGEYDRAVLICGTGIGMAIAANKLPGVRAAQAHDPYSAERARKSNNAQIISLGARVIGPELAKCVLAAWLQSDFEGGNSVRKVDKITQLDADPLSYDQPFADVRRKSP